VLAKRQFGCAANEQEFIERLPESDRARARELLETAELLFEAYRQAPGPSNTPQTNDAAGPNE
jgi:hypothetical protein